MKLGIPIGDKLGLTIIVVISLLQAFTTEARSEGEYVGISFGKAFSTSSDIPSIKTVAAPPRPNQPFIDGNSSRVCADESITLKTNFNIPEEPNKTIEVLWQYWIDGEYEHVTILGRQVSVPKWRTLRSYTTSSRSGYESASFTPKVLASDGNHIAATNPQTVHFRVRTRVDGTNSSYSPTKSITIAPPELPFLLLQSMLVGIHALLLLREKLG